MGTHARLATLLACAALGGSLGAGSLVAGASAHARRASGDARATEAGAVAGSAQQCPDPHPARRDPRNPLMLAHRPPAGNPLAGAHFFINGPRHGAAAGAIAQLLGYDAGTPPGQPLASFKDSDSWASFSHVVARRLPGLTRGQAHAVRMLEKIASQPEAQRISRYSAGGSPAGIFAQTQKLFCHNFTADPGAIPIVNTYFLHAELGGCSTTAQINAYRGLFEGEIDAMAAAIARRPVVLLLEFDAVGSSSCMVHHHSIGAWESLLRYEATTLGALPHAVVYIEGGYSDANNPRYAARILNASGIRSVQGFFTNDTHLNWTSTEVRYAEKVSRLTHGAHFIVSTSDDGRGPKLNRHPSSQGIEDLCNPPGRGLGPRTTTSTGFARADAFMWTHPPGNSSGCGGGPPGGMFWTAKAIGLAARANGRLGPGYPSRPY